MPKVSVYRGRNLLFEQWIEKDETVLGRSSEADIPLDTSIASRRHCRIIRRQNAYMLEELGAKNGLFVNGQYCNVKRLAHGDRIEVADLLIVFHRPKSEARREAGMRRGDAASSFRLSQREIEEAVGGRQSGPVPRKAFGAADDNAKTQGVTPEQLAQLKAAMEAKREAHLEYTGPSGKRVRVVLSQKRYLVGFGEDCGVNLGTRFWPWGRKAVEIVKLPSGQYQIKRLSKWVAVSIGDAPMTADHTLTEKDILTVGGHRLRFQAKAKIASVPKAKPKRKATNLASLGRGGMRGR